MVIFRHYSGLEIILSSLLYSLCIHIKGSVAGRSDFHSENGLKGSFCLEIGQTSVPVISRMKTMENVLEDYIRTELALYQLPLITHPTHWIRTCAIFDNNVIGTEISKMTPSPNINGQLCGEFLQFLSVLG